MAAYDMNPPFPRGTTAFTGAGITVGSSDGANLVGRIVTFPDLDYSQPGAPPRSEALVHCLIVRNTSGGPLLPYFLASLDTATGATAGAGGMYKVSGYAALAGGEGYPIDEFLPASGVPANDLFYVVIGGPARCLLDIAATNGNLISVGDLICALTAAASTGATSGATSNNITAGRVQMAAGTGAALLATGTSGNTDITTIIQRARNIIGRALSAATTNSTGLAASGRPLVHIEQRWKFPN